MKQFRILAVILSFLLFTTMLVGCTTEPAVFSLSNLTIEPAEVAPNETVTISVSIANTGGSQGSHDVVLTINGVEEETKSVTLAVDDSRNVTFSVTKGDTGTYSVTIEGLSGSFNVAEPAAFSLSNLTIDPTGVTPNEPVTISVSVANTGGSEGSHDVVLHINGVEEDTKSVTLAADDSRNVTFSVTKGDTGTYSVTIEGLSGSFNVAEPAAFSLSNLTIDPTGVTPNEPVTISVSVANTGGSEGSHDVVLHINGVEEDTKGVTLAAGDSEDVVFNIIKGDVGTYSVTIGELSGSFTVIPLVNINIEATATTWRNEEPYDIYSAIEEKLEKFGFKVVSGASESHDAILFVEYEENRGASYTGGAGYGTNILCSLELRDNTGNLMFEKVISDSTSAIVWGDADLYQNALYRFMDEVYFKYLGPMVATGFGFGDEVSVLISAIEDEDVDTRCDAVEVLGEIGGDRAIETLIQALLENDSYKVRGDAAEVLGVIGDSRAVEPLMQALTEDESSYVRRQAAEALGVLGDVRAVELLIQALLEDEYFETRMNAAEALGLLGDTSAVEPLIQAMLGDEYTSVRHRAAEALGLLGDTIAVEPLIQALLEDEEAIVRWSAADALGLLGDTIAVEPLIQALLEDEEAIVRWSAADALGVLGDSRAVEPLCQALLEDEDNTVRRKVAEALGEIGDERAVEALTQALEDENSSVRYAAQRALEKIQGG